MTAALVFLLSLKKKERRDGGERNLREGNEDISIYSGAKLVVRTSKSSSPSPSAVSAPTSCCDEEKREEKKTE